MKENITLIGMPGAGKSTLGVLLAKSLGFDFLDVDLLIQHREGTLLQNLLDAYGMEGFCQREEEALLSLSCQKTIIATGGSAIYAKAGMAHLADISHIVYLDVPFAEIERRLENIKTRGIAMKAGASLQDLYAQRQALYAHYAQDTIHCADKTSEETVTELMNLLQNR